MASSSGVFIPDDSELVEIEDYDDFDVAGSQEDQDQEQTESESEDEDGDGDEESVGGDDSAETQGVEGHDAETQIEGDFDRLVQNIRRADGSSNTTSMLSQLWSLNLEEQDKEFKDDLRAASGIGRRKGRKRGRGAGPTLSPQVRALIGEGNQAYVDADIPQAIQIMQEVIRIEPRASSAWSVIAQCYEDMKEGEKALQLRIMAAHLRHDADEWERLARQSRERGYFQQALYCYGKISSLDPSNVDALWDRASLAKEMGDLRTARNALISMLKRFPHDLTLLAELRPILIDLSDLSTCATLFQNAFQHYQSTYPNPSSAEGSTFTLMDILVLADLYNTLEEYEKTVSTIRKGWRWLQGRADQKWWDVVEDDREFDVLGGPGSSAGRDGDVGPGGYELDVNARQRLAVARIKMGEVEEGKMHSGIVLSHDVLDYAPLFAEIADAYFEKDMYADARPIYELLGTDAGTSSLYVLMQTAACYRMLGDLKEAANIYEHVKVADPTNNEAKMKLAEIYEILNEPRKALELVYEVIDSRKKRPASANTVSASQPPGSLSLFEETKPNITGKSSGARAKVQNRLSAAQLRELEEQKEKEVLMRWKRVRELWPKLIAGGDEGEEEVDMEWLLEAEKLAETFRETRLLFLSSRNVPFRGMLPRRRKAGDEADDGANEERMASRLHLDLGQDSLARKNKATDGKPAVNVFRGVSFDDWLRMFMQYAFLLTKRNQFAFAEEMLRHLMLSNAYQARELQDTLRLSLITCGVIARNYPVVVEQARKLINIYQFNNEPHRILLASLASGLRSTDTFISSTLQKHIFREIKVADAAVKNRDGMKWNPLGKRWVAPLGGANKGGDEEEGPDDDDDDGAVEEATPVSSKGKQKSIEPTTDLPTKNNPYTVAVYGQICVAAKSYQSALFYLLHAYDYCPDDPVICLSLAIASIGRAMQRQSDNRHHLIAQAMAFLSRYRDIRDPSAEGLDEVEFNFGRAFQQLGLHSLAVKHYERVLELAEKRSPDDIGLAREAAYNLSLIFVTTGATPLAEALYRRWLSI